MDRLFLDSEELELSGDTGIYLTYRSNIFSDITKIVGDNSATIHVPATNHNKAVIECSMIPSADSVYPYRTHTARLERDGVVMLKNATAVLMSVTPDTIELALTWGVTDALQAWVNSDLSLRDLSLSSFFIWTRPFIAMSPQTYPHAQYGFAPSDTSIGLHPTYDVGNILTQIQTDNGLTFVYGAKPWYDNNWVLPLLTRNDMEGSAYTMKMYEGYQDSSDKTWSIGTLYQNPNDFVGRWLRYWELVYYPADTHPQDPNFARTKWVTSLNNVKVTLSGTANVRVVSETDIDAWNTTLRVVGWCNSSLTSWTPTDVMADGETLLTLSPTSQSATLYGSEWRYDMGFSFTDVELDLTKIVSGETYENLYLVAESNNGSEVKNGHTLNATFTYKFVQDPIDFGRDYYITPNLPDMKQIDFVKAIMQMSGLFAFLNSSGSITFAPYSILYDNKDYARDWSAYLVHNGSTIPKEMRYSQGDECQHNKMHYHNPDEFPDWSGDYQIDNETLEYERDAVTLPFSAYKTDGDVATFPIYHYEREEVNGVETNVLKYDADTDAHIARIVGVGSPILPEEYTQLEYIESTGTQYIDTDVLPNINKTYRFQADISPVSLSGETYVIGTRKPQRFQPCGLYGSRFVGGYGSNWTYYSNALTIGDWYDIDVTINNGSQDFDGTQTSFSTTGTFGNLFLFAQNGSSTLPIGTAAMYSQAKIKYLVIYEDGVIIRNFIPCKRNADNLIGMYDLVSGTMFANAGTGAFTAGAAVNTPKYQLRNTGLTWTELLAAHYTDYIGMLNHARVLTERFILPPMELRDIDLRIPIYLEQYGSYFAISTIKTRANNEAEVELIKMS